jgi:hypothetical protein
MLNLGVRVGFVTRVGLCLDIRCSCGVLGIDMCMCGCNNTGMASTCIHGAACCLCSAASVFAFAGEWKQMIGLFIFALVCGGDWLVRSWGLHCC